ENYSESDIPQKKKFSVHDLVPLNGKTQNHKNFIESYKGNYSDTFAVTGFPGTGKTYLGMLMALQDVFEVGNGYDSLYIFRSAVETRDIGFKP
ncbi:hypothetical protein ACKI1O_49260, partial [Streptomyces scabiei]